MENIEPGGPRGGRGGRGRGGRGRGRRANIAFAGINDNDGRVVDDNAQSLVDMRICNDTKDLYQGRIRHFQQWLVENHPEGIDEGGQVAVPISIVILMAFFGYLSQAAHSRDQLQSPADIPEDAVEPYSVSYIKGYRSAIVNLYTERMTRLSEEADIQLTGALDGYEKLINRLRQRGLFKIEEGKRPFLMEGYQLLAKQLMKSIPTERGGTWSFCLFGWPFLLLMWNLMSRSDSVDKILLNHMDWKGDCLVIQEQGHKGDQTGDNKYWKHIYANVYEPWICPILALAVLIFTSGYRGERPQLFTGNNSKNRFGNILRDVMQALSDEDKVKLGCAAEDLGTHSARKGAPSYTLGQVYGPNPIVVSLRMGHSIGKVKDKYYFQMEGGDQLCGRMVAGLPFHDETFAVLPPHFAPEDAHEYLTQEYWENIVPGYTNYPDKYRAIFPYLLASLLHHDAYLRLELQPQHPLWASRVYTCNPVIDILRGKVLLGVGSCAKSGMKSTGIPPHLALTSRVKELTNEIQHLKQQLSTNIPIMIAEKVTSQIRENFNIEGVASLSLRDLDGRMASLRTDLVNEIQNALTRASATNTDRNATAANEGRGRGQRGLTQQWWQSWSWNDGIIRHYVPPGFIFPSKISVKAMWDLWHHGHYGSGIRPYRLISKQFDIMEDQHMWHCRASNVMKVVEAYIRANNPPELAAVAGILPPTIEDLSMPVSDRLFQAAFTRLSTELYPDPGKRGRVEELSYGTIYNRYLRFRKGVRDTYD